MVTSEAGLASMLLAGERGSWGGHHDIIPLERRQTLVRKEPTDCSQALAMQKQERGSRGKRAKGQTYNGHGRPTPSHQLRTQHRRGNSSTAEIFTRTSRRGPPPCARLGCLPQSKQRSYTIPARRGCSSHPHPSSTAVMRAPARSAAAAAATHAKSSLLVRARPQRSPPFSYDASHPRFTLQ